MDTPLLGTVVAFFLLAEGLGTSCVPESRDCVCVLLCALLQGREFINMHLNKLRLVKAESRPLGLLGDRLHKDYS